MQEDKELASMIFLAMLKNLITTNQALESYLEYGRFIQENKEFDLQAYWSEKQILSSDAYQNLYNTYQNFEERELLLKQSDTNLLWTTIINKSISQDNENPSRSNDEQQNADWENYCYSVKRYVYRDELGRGGLGKVDSVRDQIIGRDVAMKTLLKGPDASAKERSLLIKETCLTGQLEHPNIIPIYDMGIDADNQPYYTMKEIASQNWGEALRGNSPLTLLQNIKILQQVCMGLEYAHQRGIIHRDIKPENIMLGKFGEVLIVDWGIAKVEQYHLFHISHIPTIYDFPKSLPGTLLYMDPETLLTNGSYSILSDIYALGVILYEILTGTWPFYDLNPYSLLFQVSNNTPLLPSQKAQGRYVPVPEELEQICMKILSKNPNDRYTSCREIHDLLEEFLEGNKERERRKNKAREFVDEAKELMKEYIRIKVEVKQQQEKCEEIRKAIDPWEPLDNKIRLWEQEDICYEAEQREISVFGEVVQKYAQALDSEPGNTEARKGLAELYWNRFVEAEQQRNKLQQIFYRDLLLFYDDGTYRHLLEGKVELMLDTAPRPDGTSAKIYRYEEAQRHLQAVLQHEVSIPCKHTLSVGSYLIVLTCEGYREVCCPIYLRRGEYFDITVQLYSDEEIGETYVYIPAGKFYFGGDTEASMSLPLRQQYLDDFFISRFPITFREYLVYLNEIHKTDPKQAEALCPRSDNEIYVKLNEHNEYIPDRAKLFDGIINQRYPEGSGAEWDLPILGVSWFESILYCRWRSQKEGRKVTLPTEEQWEKAASGADHRIYPWGNTFDATFCKMGRSRRPSEMQPEPIAVFIHDESPYGVRDIVGTISEWTLTLPQEEVDKLETDPEITPVQRGGGWVASGEQLMRIGSRLPRPGGTRTYNSGFRVVTYPPKYICPPTLHNLPYDYWQVNP